MDDDLRKTLTEFLPRLRRFGLVLTRSASDADELVQYTCERMLTRSDQLRDRTRIDAWLYGIMRNRWIDELRHRKIRRHDNLDAAASVIGEDGRDVVDGRFALAAVRQAMFELPEEQRSVLVLVCVDGLTYREAAETLDIPIGTVMSRISRARLDLHARLHRRETGTRETGTRETGTRETGGSISVFPQRDGAGATKPGQVR